MMQEQEMTYEEKLTMYMKLSKKELAKMLIENERIRQIPIVVEKHSWPSQWWENPITVHS